MKEIAIYGKGGIGKSTLASNISAALSVSGSRVLQIGCDPKHDSTRLLMRGKRIETVLDYIRDTGTLDQKREDILFSGFHGVGCIEAGGPRPGVGCAGRGIITAFELLDRFHIKDDYDTVVYDVLGDVVCGGFAVPIRREYANEIFVVTSGEYMSIYAANNILRGIGSYDTGSPRVAGIIYNSRNVSGELGRVKRFAGAVGLPVFAEVPRSEVFAECERNNKTVIESLSGLAPGEEAPEGFTEAAAIFTDIAERIKKGVPHYKAIPLSDEDLESLIEGEASMLASGDHASAGAGGISAACGAACSCSGAESPGTAPAAGADATNSNGTAPDTSYAPDAGSDPHHTADSDSDTAYAAGAGPLSKNIIRNEPLHGCAFNGAVCMSVHVSDAMVLMHAPKSCAYISWQTVSSTGRRALYERGALLPSSLLPAMEATDMDESDMVFGGTDKLIDRVREITGQSGSRQSDPDPAGKQDPVECKDRAGDPTGRKPKALIVVSACPAGIIGDDVDRVKELSTVECPVITVKADGNLSGDYLQGMLMAYTGIAEQIIDPAVKPEPDTVNIVFEKVVIKNAESNFRTIKGFLDEMGIRVNCRFLYNTPYESIRRFCAASLDLLAYRDYTGKILEKFFTEKYGARFYDMQFPVGYEETERWIRGIAEYFGKTEAAERMIAECRDAYYRRIGELRPSLEGKKLFIVTYNHELDWILRAALDCGMEIVRIGVLNFSQDEGFRTSIPEVSAIDVVENYDPGQREADIGKLRPDIVLGNYSTEKIEHRAVFDTIPMCPDVGFFSGLDLVERWSGLMEADNEGEWRNDRALFEKYYA